MAVSEYKHYILFPNHNEGLRLNHILKERGIENTISPTPRAASKSCGISLIVAEDELDMIKQIINEKHVCIEGIIALTAKKNWKFKGC
ncbi:MAG: DUF3343 domain-containing protein [Syntrophomonas sp.]|uniref:DUF3343 domain-containing protein n=1 Tax=Syntrophomonas sp. TaxID=2053627 RepID=UPI002606660E|nr:DUF3343 domain-containing protein [Syntrophomonas sp.]MDD2511216.1 DUF3343 domain-containing protein [Syntrophomonas sp.]MDD3880337.1 DUF3343 domain-containing protein [Syntrophomonas sp.]MDD4627109.1 DUF3343 domain-containing protein [Syntrophomonas sp.]